MCVAAEQIRTGNHLNIPCDKKVYRKIFLIVLKKIVFIHHDKVLNLFFDRYSTIYHPTVAWGSLVASDT